MLLLLRHAVAPRWCCRALLRAAATPHVVPRPGTPMTEKKYQLAGKEIFNISISAFSIFYISNFNIVSL